MSKHRLHWFGHGQKCPSNIVVKIYIMSFCQDIKSGHSRPKRTWIERIKINMKKVGAKC